MSFFKKLLGVVAPIVGGLFGGPLGAALGGAIGGGVNGGVKGALIGGAFGALGSGVGNAFAQTALGQSINQGFSQAFGGLSGGAADGVGNLALDYAVSPSGVIDSAGNAAFGGGGGFGDAFGGGAFGGYNNPDFTGGYGNFGGTGVYNNPDFVSIPGNAGGSAGFGYVGDPYGGGGGPTENPMSFMSQAFGPGGIGFNVPTGRTLAGLYGLYESERLRKLTKLPNPADITGMPGYQAGLEAVRRSMASQGYQGSGNMMLALQKYGGDMYNQYTNQRLNSAMAGSGPATGALSSMALLSAGLGGFRGW